MRIANQNTVGAVRPMPQGSPAKGAQRSAQAHIDKLSLSPEVQRLRDSHAERVSEFKALVTSGEYRVDHQSLAHELVARGLYSDAAS